MLIKINENIDTLNNRTIRHKIKDIVRVRKHEACE